MWRALGCGNSVRYEVSETSESRVLLMMPWSCAGLVVP